MLLFGRDILATSVEPESYEAVKTSLLPLVMRPDREAARDGDRLSFGVEVVNPSTSPADAYWTLSLAQPGLQALKLTLVGSGVEMSRESRPIEIYALMGQVAVNKIVVPAGGTVRFEGALSLQHATYVGQPEAEVFWAFQINEQPQDGRVRLTLPPR